MSAVADILRSAVRGTTAAVRVVRRMQPAGGAGDKVSPPTYGVDERAPHKYCTETRRIGGAAVEAVTLDSVQSQANRIEQALIEAWRRRELDFPVVAVDFSVESGLEDLGLITTLDAPHRLADALLRDSVSDGKPFRLTDAGLAFTDARVTSATAMYRLCPTALVFGIWDSTGPKGGLGAKFARALVSEIVGVGVVVGRKTSSRIDPAQIQNISKDSPIYQGKDGDWTLEAKEARTEKGKAAMLGTGRPSEINHGNVAPSIDDRSGGVTIDYALHTAVLSLAALRKLRFPRTTSGEPIHAEKRQAADAAAWNVLAALALAGIVYQAEEGFDLRSRCVLVPEAPLTFELVGGSGDGPKTFTLDRAGARALLAQAVEEASREGLGWHTQPGIPLMTLRPAPKLADLIRRSRAYAASVPASD
jgi:CRISPR-associated protein Csb1